MLFLEMGWAFLSAEGGSESNPLSCFSLAQTSSVFALGQEGGSGAISVGKKELSPHIPGRSSSGNHPQPLPIHFLLMLWDVRMCFHSVSPVSLSSLINQVSTLALVYFGACFQFSKFIPGSISHCIYCLKINLTIWQEKSSQFLYFFSSNLGFTHQALGKNIVGIWLGLHGIYRSIYGELTFSCLYTWDTSSFILAFFNIF